MPNIKKGMVFRKLLIFIFVQSMLLVLDGNSEHFARVVFIEREKIRVTMVKREFN